MLKAQGMPINVLVIGALVFLVLIVVVGAFMFGWGNIADAINRLLRGGAPRIDVQAATVKCNTFCDQINGVLHHAADAKDYSFCTYDFNNSAEYPEHCYDDGKGQSELIRITCQVVLTTGSTAIIDSNVCERDEE